MSTPDHQDPKQLGDTYLLDELKSADADRYFSLIFSPPKWRSQVLAAYSFNLELAKTREQISEPGLGEIRLEWWREALEMIADGQVRKHPVVEAIASAGLVDSAKDAMMAVIDARVADIYDDGPADQPALRAYLMGTGAGPMRILADALSLPEPAREALSIAGYIYAMSGLVRALEYHVGLGRSTLPGQGSLSPKQLDDRDVVHLRPVLEGLSEDYREHRAQLKTLWPRLGSDVKALMVPMYLGFKILDQLERQKHDPRGLALVLDSDLSRLWCLMKGRFFGRP